MKDKRKDEVEEKIQNKEPSTIGKPETETSVEEEMSILKEINATLSEDIEFYKTQLQLTSEKLKLAGEMVATAQEADRKFKEMQLDYDNLKKRSAAAVESAEEDGIIKAIKVVLPTIDNFRRAIASIADHNTVEGLKMIYKQLMEALGKLGVEEIPALGLQFDPEIHHAVLQVDAGNDIESGIVVEVMQKGYLRGDKVIRYTQVKVAK